MEKLTEKKSFIIRVLQNTVASAVPLIVLQLFILPKISEQTSAAAYGLMLTLVGAVSLVTMSSGGTLGNVRLLMNLEYEERGLSGDFNLLASVLAVASAAVIGVVTAVYTKTATAQELAGMFLIGVLAVLSQFYVVGFRLTLSYGKVAVHSIVQAAGYLLGYLLFLKTGNWQWVYLLGYGLGAAYAMLAGFLVREPWVRTPLFRKAAGKETVLFFASILGSSISYIDRFLLYPILGGEAVTVYYVATLMGKMICVAVSPITGVMLSYFSQMKRLKQRSMLLMLLASGAVGACAFAGCVLVSRPILTYLYPQVAGDAMRYIYIATLTCVVDMIASIVYPAVLRFCNTNWQLVISLINAVCYLGISLLLLSRYGMMGFCVGALIAMTLKLLLMLGVFFYSDRRHGGGQGEPAPQAATDAPDAASV